MSKIGKILGLVLIFTTLMAACTPVTTPVATEASSTTETAPLEPVEVRFAALRVLDSLPVFVAEQAGYFEANGLDVEITPVNSAPERDQLIAARQMDGMINEVMSTLLSNRDQVTIQTVRIARAATSEHPVFRIIAGKDAGVTNLEEMKAVEVGISQGTIIEYLTDRLIEAEGFNPVDFPRVNIPAIPDRLALLNSGELKAAVLPDPASTMALAGGGVVVIDDSSHPEYGYSTYAFRKDFIDANPDALRGFLKAIEQAVADINAAPGDWQATLAEFQLIPAPLVEGFNVSPFPTAGVPSEAQFADALAWAQTKGLLSTELEYAGTVVDDYLP